MEGIRSLGLVRHLQHAALPLARLELQHQLLHLVLQLLHSGLQGYATLSPLNPSLHHPSEVLGRAEA